MKCTDSARVRVMRTESPPGGLRDVTDDYRARRYKERV